MLRRCECSHREIPTERPILDYAPRKNQEQDGGCLRRNSPALLPYMISAIGGKQMIEFSPVLLEILQALPSLLGNWETGSLNS